MTIVFHQVAEDMICGNGEGNFFTAIVKLTDNGIETQQTTKQLFFLRMASSTD